jgi:ribosome-associated toxin RatA of RatAB toxin-antitoxin module
MWPNFPIKANQIPKVTEKSKIRENLPLCPAGDETGLENNLAVDPVTLPDVAVKIEKIAERKRKIAAKIQIPHPVERIWKVLTDYEALSEFIPNLAQSCLLEHPHGGIRLEQIGSVRLLKFNFCARVVLDLEEQFPNQINFSMVEGDFKDFSGIWCLEPDSRGEEFGTTLCYTIQVCPKLTMPITIIERRLSDDLRLNLLAIHRRVEELWRSAE